MNIDDRLELIARSVAGLLANAKEQAERMQANSQEQAERMQAVDRRLEFLIHSTESLHATTQEQAAYIARLTEQISQQSKNIDKLDQKFAQVAETMGELSIAVLNHERRLGKLDGGGE